MIFLRAAQEADVKRILELERVVPEAPHWTAGEYRRLWERAEDDPASAAAFVLVESAAGLLSGFIAVSLRRDGVAEIESVAVAERHRRMGWGKHLCMAALKWCQEAGAMRCDLEVRSGSESARRLYRSLGFQEVGRRARYYRDPVEDAVLMSLQFSSVPPGS